MPVQESGGCALLLSCGLQWSFSRRGLQSKQSQVLMEKGVHNKGQTGGKGRCIYGAELGCQTQKYFFLETGDRGEWKRGLSPAFPLKTAGREQHSALHSGEEEVGRGRATSSSDNRPFLQRFSNSQLSKTAPSTALPRAGQALRNSLIHNLPYTYICVTAAMNSIPGVVQETNMIH